MIRAILFDLDRTLLDRDASLELFIDDQYDRFYEHLKGIPKADYRSTLLSLDQKGYVPKNVVYSQIVERYYLNAEMSQQLFEDYHTAFKRHCVPFEGLDELFEALKAKGFKLGMITNGRGAFQMENICALGIEDDFEVILISELEGVKKPDPNIFLTALERLGVSAEESVFVGDHLENDVFAAERMGMIGVWKKAKEEASNDVSYIIEDLQELLPLLEKVKSVNIR